MCDPSCFADHALVARGADDAGFVLGQYFGVGLTKAAGVSSKGGFVRMAGRLAERLRARAAPLQSEAVRAAMGDLSVSWGSLKGGAREAAVSRAMRAAAKMTSMIPAELRGVWEAAGVGVVQDVRTELRRRRGLAIGVDFNAIDPRVVRYVTRSHALFVRNELGRRNEALGARARKVVAAGLEAGLRDDDIARELERAIGDTLRGKTPAYWDVVASSFVGTGRSFSQLSGYAEAGIERYRLSAVLDEHTTRICRFMDGKVFSVSRAMRRFDELEAATDPDAIKRLMPWGREATDPTTGKVVLYAKQGARRIVLAVEERSGFGRRDDRGNFRALLDDDELGKLGPSLPPLHGACRTTTTLA